MPTGNNSNYDLFWQGALRQRFGGAHSDGSFVPSITINKNESVLRKITQRDTSPATTLAESCYSQMFWNCTSLTNAPELPAMTLAKSCYDRMFYNCIALTTAPALPATTIHDIRIVGNSLVFSLENGEKIAIPLENLVVQKDEDGEYRLEPYGIQQYDNCGFSLGFDVDKEEDKNGFREFIDKLFVKSPKKCDDETMLKNAKPIESLYGF